MTRKDTSTKTVLILGGAGMVGIQVAREIAREIRPGQIVISALTQREVDETIEELEAENKKAKWGIRFTAAPGDIFIPETLQGHSRGEMVTKTELFDQLFDDIFSPDPDAFKKSMLRKLIDRYKPDVVVDCINTATAISYQDVFTTSRKVKMYLDRIEKSRRIADADLTPFVESVRELLIAQGVPQITRHILYLHRALQESNVRVYVKVGTTGTGGMGVNIPYTHSEERPSATLLSKSAIGFAHTGLLFLLARTPAIKTESNGSGDKATMIKEVKPGAMIGFRRLGVNHVRVPNASGKREPGYLIESKTETLGKSVQPRLDWAAFGQLDGKKQPLKMVGADTGENGFFSIGEFLAITYPRQMEFVTPEECARTVVMEILGSSTGRDVISAIDGAITEPSYRAGVLREEARKKLDELEEALAGKGEVVPSIAIGQLGPPRLSKLLIETYLIRAAAGTSDFDKLIAIEPDALRKKVETYLEKNPRVTSLVNTIGIPILRETKGKKSITRGPRLNIPVPQPNGEPIPVDDTAIERYAFLGWVDLRKDNFVEWRERLRRIAAARPDIATGGSAAFSRSRYLLNEFAPGEVVGWFFANEADEMGIVGHRIL
ncbi:MAG: hypothetical protein ACYC7A_14025 [Thermoanaerobaculia bacterium]